MSGQRTGLRPWADEVLRFLTVGEAVAMVTVLGTDGSTPREAGARMVVTRALSLGTIGGGNLEFQAIHQARACLDHPEGTWRIQDYPLGPLTGQCCGGRVRVMIEHIAPLQTAWLRRAATGEGAQVSTRLGPDGPVRELLDRATLTRPTARGPVPQMGDVIDEPLENGFSTLTLFGAGHVGQALYKVMDGLPYRVGWFDNREDYRGTEGLQSVDEPAMISAARAAEDQVLIMTHDHRLDYRLTVAALKGGARFIGLIGSATKRARFLSRLTKEGFDAVALARLNCPIGVAGVAGKAPQIIAVSVAAQLLLNRGGAQAIPVPEPVCVTACGVAL